MKNKNTDSQSLTIEELIEIYPDLEREFHQGEFHSSTLEEAFFYDFLPEKIPRPVYYYFNDWGTTESWETEIILLSFDGTSRVIKHYDANNASFLGQSLISYCKLESKLDMDYLIIHEIYSEIVGMGIGTSLKEHKFHVYNAIDKANEIVEKLNLGNMSC